jgi:23S rRNA pseudouridine1911/1915/1917 synthase
MKIKTLFQNSNLLVLDKPAGFVVHPDGRTKQKSISEYILKNFKKIKGVGENLFVNIDGKEIEIQKPGIVHRLDKDTTGTLIIAKTQSSFENLKNQFKNHDIKKEYLALVWGHLKHDTGLIDAAIARSKSDFRKKEVVGSKQRGEVRDALTRYKVLKRLNIFGEKVTLVNFLPQTGRMHQIRIHSKSIGHPIVGDHLYGPTKVEFEKKYFKNTKTKNNTRQLLHSKSIAFHNPETGELIKVESPIPKDMKILLK